MDARDLRRLEEQGYFAALAQQGRIASGPDAARAMIRSQCGSVPDLFGAGCPPFAALRDALEAGLGPAGLIDAVSVTAPHSHWGPKAIVYRRRETDDVYEVGPLDAFPRLGVLQPTSFVFSDDGLLPVEWCEAYPELDDPDYGTTVDLLERENEAVRGIERRYGMSCFGVGLNFRFKRLRQPSIFPTVEFPGVDTPLATIRIDRGADYKDVESNAQVAWLLRSVPPLSARDLEALAYLTQRLAELPRAYARDVFERLTASSDAGAPRAATPNRAA